jgi:hypothetical protein
MIPLFGHQPVLGARAPTQPHGPARADQNTFQVTLDERIFGYGVCVRRIQHLGIASLRVDANRMYLHIDDPPCKKLPLRFPAPAG